MVGLGIALPRTSAVKEVHTSLIGGGAALTAAALIFPRLKSIAVAGIFTVDLTSGEDAHRGLRVDVWKLQRFAWLVCGDAAEARNLVEAALAEARLVKLSSAERGTYTLQSLVALLENARERGLLTPPSATRRSGPRLADNVVSDDCRPTMEALAALPVRVRMEYLLRCSWLLSLDEVVKIFGCPASEVGDAVTQGREALGAAQ
jgi:hypothetical protein